MQVVPWAVDVAFGSMHSDTVRCTTSPWDSDPGNLVSDPRFDQGGGLESTRLVISDADLGLRAAIEQILQGCSRECCRMRFLHNLLFNVPKTGQEIVVAAMKAGFVIKAQDQVRAH
jgi:Transposase, Mutator family